MNASIRALHEAGLSRRQILAHSAALAAIPMLGRAANAVDRPGFRRDPYTMGVASGDPDHTGFVIWTRLAPEPFADAGGMAPEAVRVHWEVATDESMNNVVARGTEPATPQLGHTVHVEVEGLQPDRWYWYRFRAGDAESPVGRARTLPTPDAEVARVNFAVTTCQNWEQGLFTAYEQMLRDEPDLVFHLGDYIYEYEAGRNGKVRTHHGDEIESLEDYRRRYAQYRSDPQLQAMHASCPWFVTWDDHEFDNNCANEVSEERGVDPRAYLARRQNAYQAYYEVMPLRRRSLPRGPHLQLYRKASFGRLAEFFVLDERQYRSDQPNNDRRSPINEAALDVRQTMLGSEQRMWLKQGLIGSQARWNVLAQQLMMGMVGMPSGGDKTPKYSMDQWPGYAHERMQLLQFLKDRRVPNPVVLTGDIHSNWCNELRVDDRRHDEPVVAAEFVATSLSSGGDGYDRPKYYASLLRRNPCVKFHNRQRGYIRCAVTERTWTSDYVVMDQVEKPGGKASTRATYVLEAGSPEIQAG